MVSILEDSFNIGGLRASKAKWLGSRGKSARARPVLGISSLWEPSKGLVQTRCEHVLDVAQPQTLMPAARIELARGPPPGHLRGRQCSLASGRCVIFFVVFCPSCRLRVCWPGFTISGFRDVKQKVANG